MTWPESERGWGQRPDGYTLRRYVTLVCVAEGLRRNDQFEIDLKTVGKLGMTGFGIWRQCRDAPDGEPKRSYSALPHQQKCVTTDPQ